MMTNNMDLKIGENIRKIRELKGYSQEYMAQKLGISQRTYSSIESQNDKIDGERLKAIAAILEVNVLDILAFNDKVFFANTHCTQSSVGMFNTIHLGGQKVNEVQEARIKELQEQVNHLREQVAFLQSLIKKDQQL